MSSTQLVEYLGTSRAVAEFSVEGTVNQGDAVVVVTIRPEPTENFRPHDLSLTEAQAVRLQEDLLCLLLPVISDAQLRVWLQQLLILVAAKRLPVQEE